MAIGIIGTLVQSRYVSPDDLGYFRTFSIATGYAFFLNLGLFGALQRLYPYYVGKGEPEKGIAVLEICQFWNVSVSVVVSFLYLIFAIYSISTGNWRAMLGWLSQIVSICGFIYGGYLGATFRSGHEFKTISLASILSSFGNLFILPLFLFFPYTTLALRSMFGPLINLSFMHIKRPLKVKFRFDKDEFWTLLKAGFPIFIGGYGATTFWAVVETSIILKLYGAASLGLWTIGFMVSEAAVKIPQAITAVYTPKIMEEVGRTNKIKNVLALMRKPLLFGVPAMLLISFISCIVLYYLVPIVMPKYILAIPIMYAFMLLLPLTLMELPFQILVAKGHGLKQNYAVFGGLIAFVTFAYMFNALNWGVLGIVSASMLGRLVSRLITYYFVYDEYKIERSIVN